MTSEKQEKNEEKNKPTYKQITVAAAMLRQRNRHLETEIGRQHMLIKSYEQQFAEMRDKIYALESKISKDI